MVIQQNFFFDDFRVGECSGSEYRIVGSKCPYLNYILE
jgi:hypothetical protein